MRLMQRRRPPRRSPRFSRRRLLVAGISGALAGVLHEVFAVGWTTMAATVVAVAVILYAVVQLARIWRG